MTDNATAERSCVATNAALLFLASLAATAICSLTGCSKRETPSPVKADQVTAHIAGHELEGIVPIGGTTNKNRRADIVFVHGLGGNFRSTWESNGDPKFFWPEQLSRQRPELGVWSIRYDSHINDLLGATMPIQDLAKNLLPQLSLAGIGEKPLVFITHSLGGLLVKQMLHDALTLGEKDWLAIAEHTQGVVFLATPHIGSEKADFLNAFFEAFVPGAPPSPAIDQLKHNSRELRALNIWYRQNAQKSHIDTLVLHETRKVRGVVMVVGEDSSDPGITGVIPRPVVADHISISKPSATGAFVYAEVDRFVNRCLGEDGDRTAVSSRQGLELVGVSFGRAGGECASRTTVLVHLRNIGEEVHATKSAELQLLQKWRLQPIHIAECDGGPIRTSAAYDIVLCEDESPCTTTIEFAHFIEPNGVDRIELRPDHKEKNRALSSGEFIFRAKVVIRFDADNKEIESEDFVFMVHCNERYIAYYYVPYPIPEVGMKLIDEATYAKRPEIINRQTNNLEVARKIRAIPAKKTDTVLRVLDEIENGDPYKRSLNVP